MWNILSNYVDENSLYSIGKELNIIKEKIRKDFKVVTDWFFQNCMSLTPIKFCYMCPGKNKEKDIFSFENISLKNGKEEVILDLIIDNKLSFHDLIKKIYWKVSQRICALPRISSYLNLKQEILFKEMIELYFS